MAASNLKTINNINGVLYQTGNGLPSHAVTPGSYYRELNSGTTYINYYGSGSTWQQDVTSRMFWNPTAITMSLILPDGGTFEMNQEIGDYYINRSNVTMVNGDVVSITGAVGNLSAISLTDARSGTSALNVIGVVTVDTIANNNVGRITKIGKLHNLNTSIYNEGDVLYVDPANPGKWTTTYPSASNYVVQIGIVSVKHNNNGEVDISIKVLPKLEDLSDINGTPLAKNGQIAVWNNSAKYFDFNYNYLDFTATTVGMVKTTDSAVTTGNLVIEAGTGGTSVKSSSVSIDSVQSAITSAYHSNRAYLDTINQNSSTANTVTFTDVLSTTLNSTMSERGTDSKMGTGIPWDERKKFKITVSSGSTISASLSFNDPYTSFSYYINEKKFTVTPSTIGAYSASTTANEGTWFFYISNQTSSVNSPTMVLTQTPWLIYNPDVLLWNMSYNSSNSSITWVGEERHTYGRDIFNHARNHSQGAIYRGGLLFSQYNGLTTLSTNTVNNFGRALTQISNGSFYDEDILLNINHYDDAINASVANPSTNWDRTTNQFLGFTELAQAGTTTTSIVFPSSHTLVAGQAVTVMQGNTSTVRGTTTITTGGTGTTFTVTTVTGLAQGDAIVIGARIPIYYISSVSGSNYTWRKLNASDFLGVSGGTPITAANIATATPQYNNASSGGFTNMTSVRHIPVYLAATNTTHEPIIAILGQGQSTSATLSTSLNEAPFQFGNLLGIGNLNIQEIVPFYRLTFEYGSGASYNQNRLRLVDATFINIRVSTSSGVIISGGQTSLTAGNVSMTPPSGMTSTNVQDFTSEIKTYTDNKFTDTAVAGENISQYDWVYLNSDGKVYRANATSIGTMTVVGKVSLAYSSGSTVTFTTGGPFNHPSHGFTTGSANKIYMSTSNGLGTLSAPSTTDNIVQSLGYAKDSNTIIIRISENYMVIA